MSGSPQTYTSYDQVPYYRKQWFFWIMWFILQPVALVILLFGDVYYQQKGDLKSFGLANRIIAGVIGFFYLLGFLSRLFGAFAGHAA